MLRRFFILSILMVLSISGCHRGPETFAVNGTVHYDGKPLVEGAIVFIPDGTQGNSGLPSSAQIKDGKFQIDKKAGVVAGAYLITIESGEVVASSNPTGEAGFRERFPAYGTSHVFAVDEGQKEYEINFDIPKKKR